MIIKGVRGLLINLLKVCEACSEEFCHGACVLFDYSHQVNFTTIFEPHVGSRKLTHSLRPNLLFGFMASQANPISISTNQNLTNSKCSREERQERGTQPKWREKKPEKNAKDWQSFVRRSWEKYAMKVLRRRKIIQFGKFPATHITHCIGCDWWMKTRWLLLGGSGGFSSPTKTIPSPTQLL